MFVRWVDRGLVAPVWGIPRFFHFLSRDRLAHGFNQDFRDLWAREFAWRNLPGLQHLAHLGATEGHMVVTAMRAGLGGGHCITGLTVEGVIKEHRRYAELGRIEVGKDVVSVVGPVIVADPGMIAPDDDRG